MKIESNVLVVGPIRSMPKQPHPESPPTASAQEGVSLSQEAMERSAHEQEDKSNVLAKY